MGRWRLMRKGGRLFRHGTTDIILELYLVVYIVVVVVVVCSDETSRTKNRALHKRSHW